MKLFREDPCGIHQLSFLPPVLDDVVPAGALVRILSDTLDRIDCSVLLTAYQGGGAPSYPPVMLLKVLLLAYLEGVRSSRRIAERCVRDTHYMWLAHMNKPDFHTICRFRRRHEKAIKDLFRQSVELCQEEGLVLLEHIAVDGTKLEANVSSKETYNKDRADKASTYTQQCIDAILKEAEAQDAADERKEASETIPPTGDGGAKNKKRLVKKLNRRKARAEAAKEQMEKTGNNAACATDLEARVMNTGGLNRPAYNAQAAVDSANQVIVAAHISQQVNDSQHLKPVLENVIELTGSKPTRVTADCGFHSLQALMYLEETGIDGYVAEKKAHKSMAEFIYDVEHDVLRKPATDTTQEIVMRYHATREKSGVKFRVYRDRTTGKETWLTEDVEQEMDLRRAMHATMSSPEGKAIYSLRQQIVEPTFGHLKGVINLRRLSLRGLSGATIEFLLACSAHNIKKVISARLRLTAPQKHDRCARNTQNHRFFGEDEAISAFLTVFSRYSRQFGLLHRQKARS
jgi:transposase